jgi:hypothetical protein
VAGLGVETQGREVAAVPQAAVAGVQNPGGALGPAEGVIVVADQAGEGGPDQLPMAAEDGVAGGRVEEEVDQAAGSASTPRRSVGSTVSPRRRARGSTVSRQRTAGLLRILVIR